MVASLIAVLVGVALPVYGGELSHAAIEDHVLRSQPDDSRLPDYADAERLFFQAKTKQECLAALAKYDPTMDPAIWCKEFDGNLVFQITNQSPNVDPVDFLISIDGKRVIEKEMPYGAAHLLETIAVQVPLGKHVILVESKNGQAKKRYAIIVKDRLYISIAYWYYTEKELYGPVKRQFKIETASHPFSMQ